MKPKTKHTPTASEQIPGTTPLSQNAHAALKYIKGVLDNTTMIATQQGPMGLTAGDRVNVQQSVAVITQALNELQKHEA